MFNHYKNQTQHTLVSPETTKETFKRSITTKPLPANARWLVLLEHNDKGKIMQVLRFAKP